MRRLTKRCPIEHIEPRSLMRLLRTPEEVAEAAHRAAEFDHSIAEFLEARAKRTEHITEEVEI